LPRASGAETVAGGAEGGAGQAGFSTGGHASTALEAAGAGSGAGEVQAPSAATKARHATPRAIEDNVTGVTERSATLGWVFLEIALALAVAVAIVWWTWPRKKRPPREDEGPR
jgi:hypothetical protein